MKFKNGVSMIEVIVILALVIILALIIVPQWTNVQQKAIRDAALVQLNTIAKAMKMYKYDERKNPTKLIPDLSSYDIERQLNRFIDINIYNPVSAVCVAGKVKGLSPTYYVSYCVETNEGKEMTKQNNQPACCKGSGCEPFDAGGNWFACQSKFE